jgi:hypothetical protein
MVTILTRSRRKQFVTNSFANRGSIWQESSQMTRSINDYQAYTILFQRLEDARSAQQDPERAEADRVMEEADSIKAVRELAEAASEQTGIGTFSLALGPQLPRVTRVSGQAGTAAPQLPATPARSRRAPSPIPRKAR